MKPVLAFACGDPGGIGPEVAVKAMKDRRTKAACVPVAVGPRTAWRRAGWTPSLSGLVDVPSRTSRFPRRPDAENGRVSWQAFLAAMRLCARGAAAGMVTAPVSKEAWRLGGVAALDQTELISRETGSPGAGMMICAGNLRAVLATRHLPLASVPAALTREAVFSAARQADESLRAGLGIPGPRLALCALNPHGGEEGMMGREEQRVLFPAVGRLRAEGLRIDGPLPSDSAWLAQKSGAYDALICAYHDQALAPVKLAAGYALVNWTIGAPIIRVAPGHGTAFDIAGKGKADPAGMTAAALFAACLAARVRR